MGDRANIIIKQDKGEAAVVVYSHWGGTFLRQGGVDNALVDAGGRAGDPHYFTALFVESLMKEGVLNGIGTSLDDNEGHVLVVNSETGERESDLTESDAKALLKELGGTP